MSKGSKTKKVSKKEQTKVMEEVLKTVDFGTVVAQFEIIDADGGSRQGGYHGCSVTEHTVASNDFSAKHKIADALEMLASIVRNTTDDLGGGSIILIRRRRTPREKRS